MTSDTITIIRTYNRRLAKLVYADGRVEGYDSARLFDMTARPLAGLSDVAELLHELLPRWDTAVVRGGIRDLSAAKGVRRLLYADRKTGDIATLKAVPRRWLALDVEGIPRPHDVPVADLAACAALALATLPSAFANTACIVQASGSHGFKPDIRLRLWFWCSRPICGSELKRWLRETPADPVVFGAAQPIYTARPIMGAGAVDPIAHRLLQLPGKPLLLVPPSETPSRTIVVCAPKNVHPVHVKRYVRAALVKAAHTIMHATKRHPTILAECQTLAKLVSAGMLREGDMRAVVQRAASVAGKDDPVEIENCIGWALANVSDGRTSEASDA